MKVALDTNVLAYAEGLNDAERHRLLDDDVELNCQGLEVWLDRK